MGYTQQKGQYAEELACDFLMQKGLSFLGKNYHCRYGEIDLVMQQDATIVFVEVRFRKAHNLVDALSSIDPAKQRKLNLSAENYLQQHRVHPSVSARIDVVAITQLADAAPEIDWIQNAIQG